MVKMKLLVLCAFTVTVVVIAAAPQDVQLLRYETDNDGLGSYSFAYELSDGSSRFEKGELRNAGTKDEFVAVSGSYSWIGPDGVRYGNNYIADQNGYQISKAQAALGTPAAVVATLLG